MLLIRRFKLDFLGLHCQCENKLINKTAELDFFKEDAVVDLLKHLVLTPQFENFYWPMLIWSIIFQMFTGKAAEVISFQ